MSIDILKIDNDVQEDEERLPSDGAPYILDSGVYPCVVDAAYYSKSKGGALALNLILKSEEYGTFIRQALWVTSGDAKGNRNYYEDKDGNKRLLPGMSQANELAQLLTKKDLADLDSEDKTIKLWSYETKKEENTTVPAVVDLVGERLLVGIVRIMQNKRVQQNGEWVDGPEKRELNEVSKFFAEDGRTLKEINAGEKDHEYMDAWKAKHEGNTIDKYKPVAGGGSAPSAGGKGADDLPELFG